MIKKKKYEYVIVGAGFYGAVLAERLHASGKSVLILDRRNHIGGNCFTYEYEDTNITTHAYGTHIFHTSNKAVWKYINRFSEKEKFVTALFDTNYHKAMGRSEFLPVKLEERDDEVYALPLRVKSSSVAVLAKADGFVIIEKNKEGLYSGEKIKVYEL